METAPLYIGIDVSKAQLDVAERPSGEQAVIPHTEQDIATLVEHLRIRRPACVVLEATGGLQVALASALVVAGIPVAVVNPGRCEILPEPPVSSPRPMRWMRTSWPTLPKRYGLLRAPYQMRRREHSVRC